VCHSAAVLREAQTCELDVPKLFMPHALILARLPHVHDCPSLFAGGASATKKSGYSTRIET
jgi:hypothetical protein